MDGHVVDREGVEGSVGVGQEQGLRERSVGEPRAVGRRANPGGGQRVGHRWRGREPIDEDLEALGALGAQEPVGSHLQDAVGCQDQLEEKPEQIEELVGPLDSAHRIAAEPLRFRFGFGHQGGQPRVGFDLEADGDLQESEKRQIDPATVSCGANVSVGNGVTIARYIELGAIVGLFDLQSKH